MISGSMVQLGIGHRGGSKEAQGYRDGGISDGRAVIY